MLFNSTYGMHFVQLKEVGWNCIGKQQLEPGEVIPVHLFPVVPVGKGSIVSCIGEAHRKT